VIRGAGVANHRIVNDAAQPKTNEDKDRTWRRWRRFCREAGIVDVFLSDLSTVKKDVILCFFLCVYSQARWHASGRFLGRGKKTLAGSSLRNAAGHMAAAFRDRFEQSPLHLPDARDFQYY
jgi:hypothetical protein